jgi:hypothetical protein
MSHEPTMIFRGLATLVCLVGVPTVALVGIAGDGASAWTSGGSRLHSVTGEPSIRLRATDTQARQAATHRARAVPKTVAAAPLLAERESLPAEKADARGNRHDVATTEPPEMARQPKRAHEYSNAEPTSDLMTRQLSRLQDLGATYYRLESAPHSVADFSFHCRVTGVARAFEASDPEATSAIAQVLAQIEAYAAASSSSQTPATAAAPSSIYRR